MKDGQVGRWLRNRTACLFEESILQSFGHRLGLGVNTEDGSFAFFGPTLSCAASLARENLGPVSEPQESRWPKTYPREKS